jgi:hypothetical protein
MGMFDGRKVLVLGVAHDRSIGGGMAVMIPCQERAARPRQRQVRSAAGKAAYRAVRVVEALEISVPYRALTRKRTTET